MSNVIGGGPGSTPINTLQFQQTRATRAAYQRSDIGAMAKHETKTEEPQDQMEGVKKFFKYEDGRTMTQFDDGSKELRAPNGSTKQTDSEGNMSLTLPNGITIEHEKDGQPVAFDPSTNDYVPVETEQKTEGGETVYKFKDSQGNSYSVGSDKLRFSAENPSETLTQTVDTGGQMHVQTKTLSRNPETGRFSQDKTEIFIDEKGNVTTQAGSVEEIAVNNQGIHFTSRGDLDMGIKFPFSPTTPLSGECVKPDMPPISGEPTFPPPGQTPGWTPPQTPPNYGYPGGCPGGFPGGYPGGYPGGGMPFPNDPFQQFPWPGYPLPGGPMPMPPGNAPGSQQPVNDPYAAIGTPSGMIRKKEPDGSLFISLPNGLVLNHRSDGKVDAFDARSHGKVIPVTTQQVDNPGFGPEARYNFQDAEGNLITMYSNSMDFSAASRDGNTLETVSPNGDIMINSRTYPLDQNGNPTVKNHKILITADGHVNTLGERGIQVNNKNIVFAEGGSITNYKLPYEVPSHQGLMPYIPPIGYSPYSPQPVMNPTQPCYYPGANGMASMQTPPPYPGQTEPVYPPGQGPQGEAAAKGKGKEAAETPGEKPVKPGLWKRVKNFFTGKSSETGESKKSSGHGWCSGNRWCNPYPGGYYNPYSFSPWGMMGAGTAIGLTMGATAMLSGMMMTYPMGMFCNPFGMYGMWGMW